jgi:protein-L-isoaspartate(D-aspartate) O-methyltransferase
VIETRLYSKPGRTILGLNEMMKARPFIILLFLGAFLLSCGESSQSSGKEELRSNFESRRKAMVRTQLIARGVKDERVLKAMRKVERERFVPPSLQDLAYADCPLPIGQGQTISQPYIVALMTECLELEGGERVLEIGTGSGYQAAILAELADRVYTVEIIKKLALSAEELLGDLGYTNIKVKVGNGWLGWEEYAPFDAIIVTCAPPDIPKPLVRQLAEGGRMIIPVGTYSQELKKLTKKDEKIEIADIIPVRFVPMTGSSVEKGELAEN